MIPMYAFRDAMVEMTKSMNKLRSICDAVQSWEENTVMDVIDDADVVAVYQSIHDVIHATERIENRFKVGRSNSLCQYFEVYRKVGDSE
jgi:hypothetical protein